MVCISTPVKRRVLEASGNLLTVQQEDYSGARGPPIRILGPVLSKDGILEKAFSLPPHQIPGYSVLEPNPLCFPPMGLLGAEDIIRTMMARASLRFESLFAYGTIPATSEDSR